MNRTSFINAAKEKHGDRFDYSHLSKSFKLRRPENIICKQHGSQIMLPREHLRAVYGCPYCRSDLTQKPTSSRIEDYVMKAKVKFGDRFNYSQVSFSGEFKSPVKIICKHHGAFVMPIRNHYHSKTGCVKCAEEAWADGVTKYKDLSDLLPKMREIHGDIYEYISYSAEERKITYECRHKRQTQLLRSHLAGRGCKTCGYENRTISPTEFLERARFIHSSKYEYDLSDFKTVNDKIRITHECGHSYLGRVSNHLSGQGCSRCRSSIGEKKIQTWLEANNISFVAQYKLDGFRYRYDFYIPALNMLIEYDGEQHFREVEYFGGKKAYIQRQRNDKIKTSLAKKHGYLLVRVPYTQINQLEGYLSRAIDKHFKYLVDGVFYRTYMDMFYALKLPGDLLVRAMDKYRTINVLSPLS